MNLIELHQKLIESQDYVDASHELKLNFDLANAILKARLDKGLSQEQLAEAIGTKQANISRIEAGLANPTLNVIKKLINVLEIKVEISCEKIAEIEYGSEPRTKISQPYQLFKVLRADVICSEFDISSKQSKTKEREFA